MTESSSTSSMKNTSLFFSHRGMISASIRQSSSGRRACVSSESISDVSSVSGSADTAKTSGNISDSTDSNISNSSSNFSDKGARSLLPCFTASSSDSAAALSLCAEALPATPLIVWAHSLIFTASFSFRATFSFRISFKICRGRSEKKFFRNDSFPRVRFRKS